MQMPLTAVANMGMFSEQSGGVLVGKDFPVSGTFHSTRGFVVPSLNTMSALRTIRSEPAARLQPAPSIHVGWSGLKEISDAVGTSGVIGQIAQEPASKGEITEAKIQLCCTAHPTPAMRRLVKSAIRGIKACQEPEKAKDGMGGTYFFTNDSGRKVAIFKPCDEEPLAPNNPKGYVGRQLGDPGWKPTVRVGEAAIREVAAYLLDHDNFTRVPTTVLVRARHPVFCYNDPSAGGSKEEGLDKEGGEGGEGSKLTMKLGSLQEFVQHQCDTSEMGSSRFSAKDVHRIGILDIRLFNTDRHAGNMLVRLPQASSAACLQQRSLESNLELVPIDHGFCLPEALESPYLEWLHWPQARMPFGEEELEYIRGLDIQADLDLLRRELPMLRPECLRLLEVTTLLLQRCAAAGLTLAEIGAVVSSDMNFDVDDEQSQLEKLCGIAREAALNDDLFDNDDFLYGSDCDEDALSEALNGTPTMESVLEDEELLFGIGSESPNSHRNRPPFSPTCLSLESSFSLDLSVSSDSLESPPPSSLMTPPPTSPLFATSASIAIPSNPKAPLPPSPTMGVNPMARSMQESEFLWRAPKMPIPRRRTHQSALRAPSAYPPPVVPRNTDPSTNPFSDLTYPQWQRFLLAFSIELDDLLRSGQWRDTPAPTAMVASSCPRF